MESGGKQKARCEPAVSQLLSFFLFSLFSPPAAEWEGERDGASAVTNLTWAWASQFQPLLTQAQSHRPVLW